MSNKAATVIETTNLQVPFSELEELKREYKNNMDIPEPTTAKPVRVQKGQVLIVTALRADGDKGIICKVPDSFDAYLPVGNLLGDDPDAKQLRFSVIDWENAPLDQLPIYVRVTRTGHKYKNGKRLTTTTLAEITAEEYENQVQTAEEQVSAIPNGSIQTVEVIRPAYTRGKQNEVCGLKVSFPSTPGVEALLHLSEMAGDATERIDNAQEGDSLEVLVTRSQTVNGQALFMVSETRDKDA